MLFSINSNKLFFLFTLIFSTLISISTNSWLGCWIGLEINLLSFIPLISNSNNLLNSEAALKYFLVQSIASINFLFSIILNLLLFKNFTSINMITLLINSSLLMKMGSFPFHFWFPNILEGISWMNCFILMTWQKITPLILLSYCFNLKFLLLIMICNSMIGAINGYNQTSLRKLLAFSSINNMGWMMSALLISENLLMIYFLFYSFLTGMLCFLFYMLNIFFINQMFNFNLNFPLKIFIMINLLSLGGLPPFLGFFPKWLIINYLILNKLFIVLFFFIFTSLIMLIFYIRIIYSSFMFFSFKFKWLKSSIKNNFSPLINLMNFISMTGLIINTLFFF